jgi:hypothetical protein
MAHKRLVIRHFMALVCAVALAGASAALAFQGADNGKPADAGKNQGGKSLLANGGFEGGDPKGDAPDGWKTGGVMWGPWKSVPAPGNVEYRWDRRVAHQGQASLYLKKDEGFRPPFGQWQQEVKRTGVLPRLKVSAFVKAKQMMNAHVEVEFLDKNGNSQFLARTAAIQLGSNEEPATHDWKRYEGIVEIPAGTEKFNIAPQIWGPGEVWFDDIEAEYMDAEVTEPTSPKSPSQAQAAKQADVEKNQGVSLLTNGGFEEGKGDAPDGWKTGGIAFGPLRLVDAPGNVKYQWDRKVAHQGSASLHLTKKIRFFLPPWGQWSQEVKYDGASPRIKVTAFVKAKKATKAILNVQFLDGNNQCFVHDLAAYIGAKNDGDPPATHDWKRFEGIVEIPQGTQKINIAAQICGPGEVWFDNIEAEYTNAPATGP